MGAARARSEREIIFDAAEGSVQKVRTFALMSVRPSFPGECYTAWAFL